MLRASLAAVAVLFAGGCQNLIGIDDVESHLPRVDGDYLVGIDRLRADGTTHDTLRLVGTARLDAGTRTMTLSLTLLDLGGGTGAEPTIPPLVFPEASTAADLRLANFSVPADTVMNPSGNPADLMLNASFTVVVEGDYAFCAVPADGSDFPILGSKLRPAGPVPEADMFDTDCDGL